MTYKKMIFDNPKAHIQPWIFEGSSHPRELRAIMMESRMNIFCTDRKQALNYKSMPATERELTEGAIFPLRRNIN